MHDNEKFKSLALRLSEQVAHLTGLVSKMQSSITQLQQENQNLLTNLSVKTAIPWDQTAVTTLIQPSPIKLFSSSPVDFNMFDGDLIGQFDDQKIVVDQKFDDQMNPFRTDSTPMMGYYEDPIVSVDPSSTELIIPTSLSPQNSTVAKRKISRKPSGPLKILIVEDDPLCQQLISHIIKSLHIGQCEVVADGVEAVINMSTNSFDLILMDMQLPHLDGLQAAQNIRKFNRRTPIVSMTARVSEEDIKRYFEGGIDDVLPKPFDKQSVRKIIEQFFKLSIFEESK